MNEEIRRRLIMSSYKKSPGFKIFGEDWRDVHGLCDELKENRHYEMSLLRRLTHIGHKLSQPINEDTEGYKLILHDLQRRYETQAEIVRKLEIEVAESFEELCLRRKIFLTSFS